MLSAPYTYYTCGPSKTMYSNNLYTCYTNVFLVCWVVGFVSSVSSECVCVWRGGGGGGLGGYVVSGSGEGGYIPGRSSGSLVISSLHLLHVRRQFCVIHVLLV